MPAVDCDEQAGRWREAGDRPDARIEVVRIAVLDFHIFALVFRPIAVDDVERELTEPGRRDLVLPVRRIDRTELALAGGRAGRRAALQLLLREEVGREPERHARLAKEP